MNKENNFKNYHIRKWYYQIDETLANETGILADGEKIVRKIVVAAAILNPYAGKFSKDLSKIVDESSALGEMFSEKIIKYLDGDTAESYGKSCIIGSLGEYEHGNAFLTTSFANPIRDALDGGVAWVPSTGKRASVGDSIDIPLACKDALYVRSHYDTITASFPDAPSPDEIVVIVAVSTRGRLHARLGGLKFEEKVGKDGLR
jgi:hypothetical protein|tara:strand:- start:976 stop:1584 length:609 start_codon:yes stop_codon:yes gene_type:complete